MKKKTVFRRFGAMAMAAVMSLSLLATTAFADVEDPPDTPTPLPVEETQPPANSGSSLVIEGAIPKAKYDVYELLSLDAGSGSDTGFRYSFTADLKDILTDLVDNGGFGFSADNGIGGKKAGFEISSDKKNLVFHVEPGDGQSEADAYAAWKADKKSDLFMVRFAEALRAKVLEEGITGEFVTSKTAPAASGSATTVTLTFEDMAPGYYLIMSNAGKTAMAYTVDGETTTITEKNDAPTVKKQVLEEDGNTYGKTSDKGVGDEVIFRAVIDAGTGLNTLKFIDTLSPGLTFHKLYSIRFYPRKAGTSDMNVDDITTGVVRDVYLDSNGVGADGSVTAKSYDGGKYYVGLISTAEIIGENGFEEGGGIEDSNYLKNELLTADVDDQVFTVDFATAWLTSQRSSAAWGETDAGSGYEKSPMAPNDSRLGGIKEQYPDYPDEAIDKTGAMYNHYVGNVSDLTDDGGLIVVTYSAVINKDAVIGGTGNKNTVKLEYGNDPSSEGGKFETSEDSTYTYVYGLDILKYVTGSLEAETGGDEPLAGVFLEGAKFELRRLGGYGLDEAGEEPEDTVLYVDKYVNDSDDIVIPKTVFDKAEATFAKTDAIKFSVKTGPSEENIYVVDEEGSVTELESGDDGRILIEGLDSDLYQLVETAAPNGYNKADAPFYVILGSIASETADLTQPGGTVTQHTYVYDGKGDQANGYKFPLTETVSSNVELVGIANAAGLRMPSTGGIGTTIFYVTGAALALCAVCLLVAKKRACRAED